MKWLTNLFGGWIGAAVAGIGALGWIAAWWKSYKLKSEKLKREIAESETREYRHRVSLINQAARLEDEIDARRDAADKRDRDLHIQNTDDLKGMIKNEKKLNNTDNVAYLKRMLKYTDPD